MHAPRGTLQGVKALIAIVIAVLGLTAPAPPPPADPPFGQIDKCLTFPIGCANEGLLPSAAPTAKTQAAGWAQPQPIQPVGSCSLTPYPVSYFRRHPEARGSER
jgi:hypothetical protein